MSDDAAFWEKLKLGLDLKKAGDLTGAESAYRAALEIDPEHAVAWQCLGLLEEDKRDYAAAVDCFEACVEHGGASAAVLANLGKLQYQVGRIDDAHESMRDAVEREPGNAHYRDLLRRISFARDLLSGASVESAIATHQIPDDQVGLWLETACGLLGGFGHADAARRVAEAWARIRPDSVSAKYLSRALAGDRSLDKPPPEYVAETFDAFAEGFDAKLVGVLGYDIPEKICALVKDAAPSAYQDALDAGCGTGLCGPLLRPFCRTLTGVDISPKMIDLASKRGSYDALVCAELTAFFAGAGTARFDLVVAADVMNYFGDLAPVFAAAAKGVRPSGLVAFSTELGESGGFRLQTSGRFAHSPDYVSAAAAPWFEVRSRQDTTIRLEVSERVKGTLFLLRRRAA